jgi:hypothetical protein
MRFKSHTTYEQKINMFCSLADQPVRRVSKSMLIDLKQKLNETKTRITNLKKQGKEFLFNQWTRQVNPYENMTQYGPKVINRAFFKLWEILHFVKFNSYINISHNLTGTFLCESPGCFVECMDKFWVDFMKRSSYQFEWKAVTLYDTNISWSFKPHIKAEHVIFADLLKTDLSHLKDSSMICTGDGGFDIKSDDLNNQELLNHDLFEAQVNHAIQILQPGGLMIVKLFDMFEEKTLTVIKKVTLQFTNVLIVKPKGSRACNSERYLVGVEKNDKTPLFTKSTICQLEANLNQISYDMGIRQLEFLNQAILQTENNTTLPNTNGTQDRICKYTVHKMGIQ